MTMARIHRTPLGSPAPPPPSQIVPQLIAASDFDVSMLPATLASLVDRAGVIVFINRLDDGFEPGQVLGSPASLFADTEHREELVNAIKGVFADGHNRVMEARFSRADGSKRWYSCHVGSMPQRDFATIIARDITEVSPCPREEGRGRTCSTTIRAPPSCAIGSPCFDPGGRAGARSGSSTH
jgi:PAS domain S-box-containing protein